MKPSIAAKRSRTENKRDTPRNVVVNHRADQRARHSAERRCGSGHRVGWSVGRLVGRARRIAVGESRRSIAVGSFESSERGRSERHCGSSRKRGHGCWRTLRATALRSATLAAVGYPRCARLGGKTASPSTAALWGAGGTWRCVATRVKHSKPKRSADGRGAGRAARRNKKRLGRPQSVGRVGHVGRVGRENTSAAEQEAARSATVGGAGRTLDFRRETRRRLGSVSVDRVGKRR